MKKQFSFIHQDKDQITMTPSSKFATIKTISFIQEYYTSKQLFQINLNATLVQFQIHKKLEQQFIDLLVPYAQSYNVSQQSSFIQVTNLVQPNIQAYDVITQCKLNQKQCLSDRFYNQKLNQDQNFTDQQQRLKATQFNEKFIPEIENEHKNNKKWFQNKQNQIQTDQQNISDIFYQAQNSIDVQSSFVGILSRLQKTANCRQQKIQEWNKQINNLNHHSKKTQNANQTQTNSYFHQDKTSLNQPISSFNQNIKNNFYSINQQNQNKSNYLNCCKFIKCEKKSLKQQILKKIQNERQKNVYNKQFKSVKEDKEFLLNYLQ